MPSSGHVPNVARSAPRIKLVLVDDHPIVLRGLLQLLSQADDCEVVASCADADSGFAAVQRHRPDVLLLDLRMPQKDGLSLLRTLSSAAVTCPTILLTAAIDHTQVADAIKLGARGLVLKDSSPDTVIECVRRVHAGGEWFDQPSVTRALTAVMNRISRPGRVSGAHATRDRNHADGGTGTSEPCDRGPPVDLGRHGQSPSPQHVRETGRRRPRGVDAVRPATRSPAVNLPPHLSYRVQIERVIAGGRVALAAASLFGVWWDPAEPARAVAMTYALSGVYLAYALTLLGLVWERPRGTRLPLVTHVGDIVFVAVLQYLTLGPSSPFFLYFVFSIFCAALRWNWKGILLTAGTTLASYLLMTAWITRMLDPSQFEGDRFIIRCVYLVVVAAILAYLNHHHQRLRVDLERLARWPQLKPLALPEALAEVLSHAATIVDAAHVVVIWETGEEPYTLLARWPPRGALISKHPPDTLRFCLDDESSDLEEGAFVAAGPSSATSTLLVANERGSFAAARTSLHPDVRKLLEGDGLASASFRAEHVTGRAFFTGLASPISEIVPLAVVVAREIGLSLNQLYAAEQLKELAAKEERIRVARDLHDGILQSL